MAELEKLGSKYRIALKLAKDPRIQRLSCSHPGTYADDCLVNRVMQHKCFIVATNDADLKRRIRKVPGCRLSVLVGIRMWLRDCLMCFEKRGERDIRICCVY